MKILKIKTTKDVYILEAKDAHILEIVRTAKRHIPYIPYGYAEPLERPRSLDSVGVLGPFTVYKISTDC